MPKKILILVKENASYGTYGYFSTGLFTSASFIKNALKFYFNLQVIVEKAIDGNDIDRRVYKHKPTHCILEAIWATPAKLLELAKLHPKVQWIVRIHSKTTFLANEGNAISWIKQYSDIANETGNVRVAFNAKETYEEFKKLHIHSLYLPNFYFPDKEEHKHIHHSCFDDKHGVHISSFGALRPMKNQLIQAIAAIEYADSIGKKLYFHINGTRTEQKGEQVLKNINALFENSRHELVAWPWLSHEEFCSLIKKMDLSMQLSLSESFNIVTADAVYNNVSVLSSNEVSWLPCFNKTSVSDTQKIIRKIKLVLKFKTIFLVFAKLSLENWNVGAYIVWRKYLNR